MPSLETSFFDRLKEAHCASFPFKNYKISVETYDRV